MNSSSPSQTQQLATRLIHGNSLPRQPPPIKACIAIAGGGSTATSAIASTSGASSLLLESIVTYDRRSFAEFVTKNHLDCDVVLDGGGDDGLLDDLSDATTVGDGDAINNYPPKFSFCSTQAAILLSQAALSRSIQLSP